jgi:tetratricopeptide (TPR) repeat protein
MHCAYEDVAEDMERAAQEECKRGHIKQVVEQLKHVAGFFEQMENKNEENCQDLADVYRMIGEIYQYVGNFEKSLPWLEQAIIVDDGYDGAYHSLALSYNTIGKFDAAIRCLTAELHVAPENIEARLMLADLYAAGGKLNRMERILSELLDRDPDNVQALQRLIRHADALDSRVSTELLRRRLIRAECAQMRNESIPPSPRPRIYDNKELPFRRKTPDEPPAPAR